MRSICEILWAAVDGEINTPAHAAQMLDSEAISYATALKMSPDTARVLLCAQIRRAAALCPGEKEDRILQLFQMTKETSR